MFRQKFYVGINDLHSCQEYRQEVYDKIMVKKGIVSQENLDIAKNGVTGNAVVNSLNPTGRIENGNPELEIKMTITKENGEKIKFKIIIYKREKNYET